MAGQRTFCWFGIVAVCLLHNALTSVPFAACSVTKREHSVVKTNARGPFRLRTNLAIPLQKELLTDKLRPLHVNIQGLARMTDIGSFNTNLHEQHPFLPENMTQH
jgi:hypothetical protein